MQEIKMVKLNTIKKNPNNPRIVKDDGFKKLKESLSGTRGLDHFYARPCIVSTRTGEHIIIAGNTRYQAAKDLGWKEVPTVILEDLTEEQEKEIIIRDNVSNGEWDWEKLANEWDTEELSDWGVDVPSFGAVDYSVLEEENETEEEDLQKIIENMKDGTRKAIIVEFALEIYEEAKSLVEAEKKKGNEISLILLDALRNRVK